MARVSKKAVQFAFERLCVAMGQPFAPMTPDWTTQGGRNVATVGVWVLDHAPCYGGYVIERIDNESGGVSNPFSSNRMGASEFVEACNMAYRAVQLALGSEVVTERFNAYHESEYYKTNHA